MALKNFLFLLICSFYLGNCFGQDTIERKNRLSDSVIERFHVIKTNPDIKQGLYRAFFQRKTLIAFGNYKDNIKTGVWNYYKQGGQLVQSFDYDHNALTYEAAADTDEDVRYLLDSKLKIGDRLTRPVKIGGVYYGFIPFLNMFKLPFDTYDVNTNSFRATLELVVSPLGRLADYKVHVVSHLYDYEQTIHLAPSLFSETDQMFLPATLNGETVVSRIIIKCFVASDGGLDFL